MHLIAKAIKISCIILNIFYSCKSTVQNLAQVLFLWYNCVIILLFRCLDIQVSVTDESGRYSITGYLLLVFFYFNRIFLVLTVCKTKNIHIFLSCFDIDC